MKKILPLLILLMTAGSLSGGTFHGQWIVRDASSNAVKFSSFTIQPISTYGTSTSNTITGDRKTFRTDSDGSVIVSNLFNGRSYRVQITGANFTTTFTNSFDTNVSGLVNGADYLSAPIRDAGLVAYSQAQSDSRFLRTNISHLVRPGDNITITTNGTGPSQYLTISSTASGGGSATNVNFYPGQSTTWRTVNDSNVVDVTGTLTNNTSGNASTATTATNAVNSTNLYGAAQLPLNLGGSFQVTGNAFDDVVTFNGEAGRVPLQIRWLDAAVGSGGIYSDEYNGNGIGLTNIPGASITGTLTNAVSFYDADNLWTATTLGAALEEINNSINAGVPNGAGAKVHWSQLLGVPAGFSDGTDDGAVGGSPGGSSTYVQYNNAGSFAGEDAFAYTAASDTLTLSNLTLSGTMTVSGSLNLNTLNVTNSIWYGAATLTNADNAIAAASITNGAATASSIAGYDANKKLTSITDLPSTTTTPTASAGDNDTSVATTAFTTTAVANATNLTNLRVILNSSSNNWNGSFTGNGTGLTNLTLNLQTNANNAGVLACGKTTFTNITGNITIAGFSGVDLNFNQFAKLWITNSTATSYSVTVPASVSTSTNTFVLGKAFWVTNGSALTINFDLSAWGTNAAAVRWTP